MNVWVKVNNVVNGLGFQNSTDASGFEPVHIVVTADSIDPPVITKQPMSAEYLRGDVADELTIEATAPNGISLAYQWYVSTDNSTYTPIEGATESTYEPVTGETGIFYYRCEVTAAVFDLEEITISNSVTVTVKNIKDTEGEIFKGTGDKNDPFLLENS